MDIKIIEGVYDDPYTLYQELLRGEPLSKGNSLQDVSRYFTYFFPGRSFCDMARHPLFLRVHITQRTTLCILAQESNGEFFPLEDSNLPLIWEPHILWDRLFREGLSLATGEHFFPIYYCIPGLTYILSEWKFDTRDSISWLSSIKLMSDDNFLVLPDEPLYPLSARYAVPLPFA